MNFYFESTRIFIKYCKVDKIYFGKLAVSFVTKIGCWMLDVGCWNK